MPGDLSTPSYPFGDLLALARQSWVEQMAERLALRGFPGYRRTDAAVMRLLDRRTISIGALGAAQGVSRQAARKVVAALEQRGLAALERDSRDARQSNIVLSDAGMAYARAVREVVEELNREVADRVDRDDLAATDRVLRASVVPGSPWASIARRLPQP